MSGEQDVDRSAESAGACQRPDRNEEDQDDRRHQSHQKRCYQRASGRSKDAPRLHRLTYILITAAATFLSGGPDGKHRDHRERRDLFETPQDALRAIKGGVDIKELNVGSMAHSLGKVAVNKVLSLGKEDVETFDELKSMGITFDVRKVPTDSKEDMNAIIEKARTELANM